MMTIYQAQQTLKLQLQSIYDEREAAAITFMVMEKITGFDKTQRLIYKNELLNNEQQKLWTDYSNQLLQHRPIQYVLENAWFYGMELLVNEHVLIPRPETEELIEWILEQEDATKPMQVLDIGTGSGCIPIALKKKCPHWQVTSIDISKEALFVAQQNAAKQAIAINFQQVDFLNQTNWLVFNQYDLIVSNPPYIGHQEKAQMQPNVVQHEPHLALFVSDADPLVFYRQIEAFARQHLKQHGSIYLEINEQYGKATQALFENNFFESAILKKDIFGKDRMLMIKNADTKQHHPKQQT